MAKSRFSKEAFVKAAENVSSGDGDFPIVAAGTYKANVAKAFFKFSDSGAEGVNFGFQIDADDDNYPSQYVWFNQNLVQKNGDENMIGLQQFVTILNGLTDGHVDLKAFAEFETRDSELEKLLGTSVKIHVNPKVDGEFTNSNVKIRALLENVYAKNSGQELKEEDIVDTVPFKTENVVDAVEPESKVHFDKTPGPGQAKLEKGMKIKIGTMINGEIIDVLGTCIEYVDTGVAETSMIVMKPDRKDLPEKVYKPNEIARVSLVKDKEGKPTWNSAFKKKIKEVEKVEEIEELEEINEWELIVDGVAAFTNKGKRHSGLVLSIDENTGKAVIQVGDKKLNIPILRLEKP